MLNLEELEQLVTFADLGTLSKAAEHLHISQPSITRTMQHLEDAFGVSLFVRGKNRIALNQTGEKAVALARTLLADADHVLQEVQSFDRRLHTIAVESCAPAPLWTFLPKLAAQFPDRIISSKLTPIPEILTHVQSGTCEFGIIPFPETLPDINCTPLIREELSVCLTKGHALARAGSVTFAMLNGFNCLLRSEIGFWNEMCRKKMPSSRFLVQTDDFEFKELIKNSSLPCFTTNLATDLDDILKDRIILPVTDPEANVTYHLLQPHFRRSR